MPSHPDRVRANYDWKDIPSVVTADDVKDLDIEAMYAAKRVESQNAFDEWFDEWRRNWETQERP